MSNVRPDPEHAPEQRLRFRVCTPEDQAVAVPLMFNAGPDSYRYVFSQDNKNQAVDFLHYAYSNNVGEFSYSGHMLAFDGDTPVGIVGMWQPNENFSHTLDAVKAIFSFYGWRKGFSVIRRGLKFESIVQPPSGDVLCLHNFSVDESQRSRGFGREIIQYVCDSARERRVSKVCLDVDQNNPRARALYLGQGFTLIRSTEGKLKGRFTSVGGHDYMEKSVQLLKDEASIRP